MPSTSLRFGKIVATPTSSAWSQAYNAGGLFAVLALTSPDEETDHDLRTIGKTIISNFEAEFFTLEEKSLASIKQALSLSLEHIPEAVTTNVCLAYNKEDVLYIFIAGSGRVTIKRDDKLSTILNEDIRAINHPIPIHASSGKLMPKDLILLQTRAFIDLVSDEALQKAMTQETPDAIAEVLTPIVHQEERGDAAAIIVGYSEPAHEAATADEEEEQAEISTPPSHPTIIENAHTDARGEEPAGHVRASREKDAETPSITNRKRGLPHLPFPRLSHKQKVFLSVAVILFAVLAGSVIFTINRQQAQKTSAEFQSVYSSATTDYEEGQGLLGLNRDLARDEFSKAQQTILTNKNKFKPGSAEDQKLSALLTKVESELGGQDDQKSVKITGVELTDSPLLEAVNEQKAIAGAQTEDTIVLLKTDEVVLLTASTGKKATIANDEYWTQAVGVGAFGSNVYVLDTKEGVLKFVPTGNDYTKTSYFTGDANAPDLKNAVSMAIDGSVWILEKNGAVQKFTKAKKDPFALASLPSPLNNPTRIWTGEDANAIYILDHGNNRIVQAAKDGTYQAQYAASELGNATEFTVDEAKNAVFFLSSGKLYQFPLQK